MRCLEEAQAAGGGCKSGKTFFQDILLLINNSYTVVSDMAQSQYIHQSAPNEIWPKLLYLYHRNNERRPLHMVQGVFY